MKRLNVVPRANYKQTLETQGLSFHSWDNYWSESVAYEFTLAQIETIEAAAEELNAMSMNALRHVLKTKQLGRMGIPSQFHEGIEASFDRGDFSLYARFDFAYDGMNPPKLLELNFDTPTSLLEQAVCSWQWMEDVKPDADQFNSLHERLIEHWRQMPGDGSVHIATLADNEEDWVTGAYLLDTLTQAGREGVQITVEEIGYDHSRKIFVDGAGKDIQTLFKLYPWEWIWKEEFGPHVAGSNTRFVEPMWKSVLSSKAILPILWELYPDHPNLLPAFFESGKLQSFARKPIYSREGANVSLVHLGNVIAEDDGPYGAEGWIEQQLCLLPEFDGHYPVVGAWIVGGQPAGMTIREDTSPITTNMSNFVQHYFI
ncbi:glutathionylspermidine synthase family protein [Herbaspirillum sp. RV1423]|uniref:glutathionylspermidine synthase family protein n=1 Tax=Herbaspirillum sp. RV1423 TaxID=1443993 RepID=UPI0004AFA88B|nr:glutathionylspermidine synthase family protein [Herbaspirillum sp. RV1423]